MSETSTLMGTQVEPSIEKNLALVPTPPATATPPTRTAPWRSSGRSWRRLGFRHIGVVHDEYAVSPDGMKMFGVLDLETEMHGSAFPRSGSKTATTRV